MVLCFSGTGNSRYVAGRIAEALKEKIVDLNGKIKTHDYSPVETGHDVIVVTPTYAWRIPHLVSQWLSRTELSGAERIWFVMDCGGEIGNAAKYNRRLAEEKNLNYMGTAPIIMPENYIAMFGAPEVDEARRIVAEAEPGIDAVIARIKSGESFPLVRNNFHDRVMSGLMNPVFYRFFAKASQFRVSDSCTGCGLCARNCPMNNINLEDGKPVWGKDCTHCMACICYCPCKAIEYGKKSVGKPRYHFEELKIQ